MITMRNWYVFVPENEMHIGYTGENQVFQLEIQTDSPPDWEYKLDLRYRSGQRNFLLLNCAENVLSCTLLREHLENGRVKAQIRAVHGEKEKHSNMFDLVVDGSILASKAFEKLTPSAFSQLENRLAALHLDTEAAAGAAQESVEEAQIAANTAAAAASTAEQAASVSANAAASAQGSKTQAAQEVTKAALEVRKALEEAERAAGQAAKAEQSAELPHQRIMHRLWKNAQKNSPQKCRSSGMINGGFMIPIRICILTADSLPAGKRAKKEM